MTDNPYNAPNSFGFYTEVRSFSSVKRDGRLMYPGPRVLTWVAIFPGVFALGDISEAAA